MVPEAYCWLFIYCIVRCGVDSDARLEEVLRCSNQSVLQNPPALRRCDKSFADSRVIPENTCRYTCAFVISLNAKHGNKSARSKSSGMTGNRPAFERASTGALSAKKFGSHPVDRE
jgi:hypothetical protein